MSKDSFELHRWENEGGAPSNDFYDSEDKTIFPRHNFVKTGVDALRKIINDIQNTCQHQFALASDVDLEKKSGVFIGDKNFRPIQFQLKCRLCSLELTASVIKVCPRCLSGMRKNKLHRREIFYGSEFKNYEARIYYCPRCSLKIAVNEWVE